MLPLLQLRERLAEACAALADSRVVRVRLEGDLGHASRASVAGGLVLYARGAECELGLCAGPPAGAATLADWDALGFFERLADERFAARRGAGREWLRLAPAATVYVLRRDELWARVFLERLDALEQWDIDGAPAECAQARVKVDGATRARRTRAK